MGADNDKEAFEDAIRDDIRREILNSTSRRNRYIEQIEQIHREEEEKKRLPRSKQRKEERRESRKEEQIDNGRVDHTRYVKERQRRHKAAIEDDIQEEFRRKDFIKGYAVFCVILVALSGLFLSYVWRSIKLYEATRPEYQIEETIADIKAGKSADDIIFPSLEGNEFSNIESMKDGYIEALQKGNLTYRFAKEDFQTGDREYLLYEEDTPVAKITMQAMHTETRLGLLPITKMQLQCIEPIMNILVWDYDIEVLDSYHVYINDVEVSSQYRTGEVQEVPEWSYLYEYVDMPKIVDYHVEGIYKDAKISIKDGKGNEIPFETEGSKIIASLNSVETENAVPSDVATEVDALQAAKTWSLFTTRDLNGPNHGLDQVRAYFINDSYYWQKLGEYARGIDITLVSDHNASETTFTEESVTEYRKLVDDCFSCRVSFNKHMQLFNVGKEQIDKTDSIFYFVRIDDTDDGIDNPAWKIADIQAVVKQ